MEEIVKTTTQLAIVALVAGLLSGTAAQAGSPYGTWLRPTTGGHIMAFRCGGGLGLKVTKSRDPAKVGKTIMCGAKPSGTNRYQGSIRNLEDGNTYTGKVLIKGRKMDLSGCVMGGLFCKTETWRRIK